MEKKQSFAIIGAGNVGCAFGCALQAAGYQATGICSKTEVSARYLGEKLAVPWTIYPAEAVRQAELILLTVPDRLIAKVAEELVTAGTVGAGQYIYHASGALPASILESAKNAGAYIGSLHPLQTFSGRKAPVLRGVYFGLEGDEAAVAVAEHLTVELGGYSLRLKPEQKLLYHAAACTAANYLTVLLHYAVDLLQKVGLQEKAALQALLPLVRGTADNLAVQGTVQSLSGPIVRGDRETVQLHLQALTAEKVDTKIYRLLGDYATCMAASADRINLEEKEKIRKVLREEENE